MTDRSESSRTEPATLRRLRRRRAADKRFRLYGIGAIVFALSALALLLVSIGAQGLSAMSYHKVRYDVVLRADVIAPPGADAPEEVARNVEGFFEVVRDNLLETFPEARESPVLRRQLGDLVTRLAVLPAAREVASRPELIGRRYDLRAPLNDDLDLYLKGQGVDERRIQVGQLSSVEHDDSGRVQLLGGSAFSRLIIARQSVLAEFGDGSAAFSILLTSGVTTGRVEDVSNDIATVEVLTGSAADFLLQPPLGRILLASEAERPITDQQIAWTLALKANNRIDRVPRWSLLTNTDSTYPELAGALAAIAGSLLTMLITALFALPIGIFAAVYLEEFAPKNRLTEIIEVNINNLAAVPSIVFGLLGAALFLNFIGLPRSAPVVGGLVLALMTFPVVIIASRAALQAVPPSIRDGALAVGASRMQTVFHHVVPLAAPGILTGAILGMARAIGETAPLLLIGMVAFVGDVPSGPLDESTVLPVLIFSWSNNAERAWEPMTAALIIVLLIFLLVMNGLVVILRRKFERRW
jgi:phosphate transport system permease protein